MKLAEIDRLYRNIQSLMSVDQRIRYCSQLIYRSHQQLDRHYKSLTREARNRSLRLLQLARVELHELLDKNNPQSQEL